MAAGKSSRERPRVSIIGGGGTGAALAYDLAQRGAAVTLFERGELTSGSTGRHHGQLHCGARYAVADPSIARECWEESVILRRLVPGAIEDNGGYFVAVTDEEADYAPRFMASCGEAGIPVREISVACARELEPALSGAVRRVVVVPDGAMDAFRVPLAFLAAAMRFGAVVRPFTRVEEVERRAGRVTGLRVLRLESGREERVEADYVVNAGGAWAGEIGGLAGVDVPLTPAAGTMVAVKGRVTSTVISRLRPAGDGDIIVPKRGVSVIGSTQWEAASPDGLLPRPGEAASLLAWADEMVSGFSSAPLYAVWTAARPLASRSAGGSRAISRDFSVLDHAARDRLAGFCSVVGGKATVLRAMAEKAADLVCGALDIDAPCRTRETPLPSPRDVYRGGRS